MTTGSGGGTATTDPDLPSCDLALPSYTGPLCGVAASPCNVLTDDRIGGQDTAREEPVLALDPGCQPHLFYTEPAHDAGFYADRVDGQWQEAQIPGTILRAGHVIASDGTAYVLADDDAYHLSLRARAPGGGWETLEDIPDLAIRGPHTLAIDDSDRLHAALFDADKQPSYGVREASWTMIHGPGLVSVDVNEVATTPGGAAHLVYQEIQAGAGLDVPVYTNPDMDLAPEMVAEPGTDHLDPPAFTWRLGVSAAGEPLVLLTRTIDTPGLPVLELSIARRGASGWALTPLLGPQTDVDPCTGTVPQNADDTCEAQKQVYLYPIAVVVSRGGDERFLYGRHYTVKKFVASCESAPNGEMVCAWKTGDIHETGGLEMAAVEQDGSVTVARLADGFFTGGSAVIDRTGVVHVAAADLSVTPETGLFQKVRYFRLGP